MDAVSARTYLMHGAYVIEGVETNLDTLSTITLQLSQMTKLPKPAMEAFQALAFLIDDAQQKQLMGMMSDLVEKSLDTTLGHAKVTMEEATDNLLSTALSATNMMDEFWEECQRLTADLKEVTEGAVETITEAPGRQVDERREKREETTGGRRRDICGLSEEECGTTATSACRGHSMRGNTEAMSVAGKGCGSGGRWDGRTDRKTTGGES